MDGLVTLVLGAPLEKNQVVPLSISSNDKWVGYIYIYIYTVNPLAV